MPTNSEIKQLKLNDSYAALKGKKEAQTFNTTNVRADAEEFADINLVVEKLLALITNYNTFKRDVVEALNENSKNIKKLFKKVDEISCQRGLKKKSEKKKKKKLVEVTLCSCFILI